MNEENINEEEFSNDYPIGGSIEPYDIAREQDLLDKDDEVADLMGMFNLNLK